MCRFLFEKIYPLVMPVVQRIAGLNGRLRDIPPFVLARAFLGMFFSYHITEVLLGPAMPPELRRLNAMDHFVDIFLHGILSEETA